MQRASPPLPGADVTEAALLDQCATSGSRESGAAVQKHSAATDEAERHPREPGVPSHRKAPALQTSSDVQHLNPQVASAMNENISRNSADDLPGWFAAGEQRATLDLAARGPPSLNPWDIVLCISGTVISCENAVVVAIIFYTPALRTPMFLLVGSLATADLLAGLGLIVHFVFLYCLQSELVSLVTVGLLVSSFTASICSLLAITVDRYLSLYNALTYYSERTVTRTYLMLLLTWGVSVSLGLLPIMGWNCVRDASLCGVVRPLTKNNLIILSVSFFMVFGMMLQLYMQICKIVCRHAHQIALQRHFLATSHYVTTRKGISTLAVILGTFAVCWLPFAIYCLMGDYSYPRLYTYLTFLPAIYNSMINPVIYAYRNQDIQKVLWTVCCGCFSSKLPFRSRSPSDV